MSNKAKASIMGVMTALYCTIITAMPAFATGAEVQNAVTQGIKTGTEHLWNIMVAIVAPIGAIALCICAVKIFWGGQRAAEEAKSMAVKIVIAIAVVLLAPALISMVKGWFAGAGGGWDQLFD